MIFQAGTGSFLKSRLGVLEESSVKFQTRGLSPRSPHGEGRAAGLGMPLQRGFFRDREGMGQAGGIKPTGAGVAAGQSREKRGLRLGGDNSLVKKRRRNEFGASRKAQKLTKVQELLESRMQRGWKLETRDSQAGSVGRREQKAPPSPSTIGMIPTAPNAPPGNLQCCRRSHHGEILAHINGP